MNLLMGSELNERPAGKTGRHEGMENGHGKGKRGEWESSQETARCRDREVDTGKLLLLGESVIRSRHQLVPYI